MHKSITPPLGIVAGEETHEEVIGKFVLDTSAPVNPENKTLRYTATFLINGGQNIRCKSCFCFKDSRLVKELLDLQARETIVNFICIGFIKHQTRSDAFVAVLYRSGNGYSDEELRGIEKKVEAAVLRANGYGANI